MKNLNFKHMMISSATVYVLGITAYVGSFFVPLMENAELQANVVLMVAIVPAATFGAHLYYRKGHTTHGLALGGMMFIGAMILDTVITVPVFIIPSGGDHLSFFSDPGFWLIGIVYVITVAAYAKFKTVYTQKVKLAKD